MELVYQNTLINSLSIRKTGNQGKPKHIVDVVFRTYMFKRRNGLKDVVSTSRMNVSRSKPVTDLESRLLYYIGRVKRRDFSNSGVV